jgi:hypothetical protein
MRRLDARTTIGRLLQKQDITYIREESLFSFLEKEPNPTAIDRYTWINANRILGE